MPAFLTSKIRFSSPSPPFPSYGPANQPLHPTLLFHSSPSPCLTVSGHQLHISHPLQYYMAVTHADLSINRGSSPGGASDHGGKLGVFLIVLCILCGLSSFILCLIAEALRSEATLRSHYEDGEGRQECVYSGSGKTPLFCALAAFLILACAMFMKHGYILLAVSQPTAHPLLAWSPDSIASSSGSLVWQACFFFIASWICFAAGEVLLMIGISVESGHLSNWSKARTNCVVNRPGLFAAAGIFGLTTVFLAAGLYLTALRAQRLQHHEATIRREVLETSYMYSSPVASPTHPIPLPRGFQAATRPTQEHAAQPSRSNLPATVKPSNSVR